MALQYLKEIDGDLAERVSVVKDMDLRLVLIDATNGVDKFCHLQGLQDSSLSHPAFYCFSCWGDTGSRGKKVQTNLLGPFSEEHMRSKVEEIFEERTGCKMENLKAGDRALPGKYWLQQQIAKEAEEEGTFRWEYYVDDGVDGKRKGWHPYEDEASEEVEELYLQHVANEKESRTATRVISSGYFSYKVDLQRMTQQNTKTGKVRTIRRTASAKASKPLPKGSKVAKKTVKKLPSKRVKKTVLKKPAEKAMKSRVKAMKAKLTKKASPIASGKYAKSKVWSGKKAKTSTGLKKADLKKNKEGKLVSKKQSEAGRKAFAHVACWIAACKQARAELGITGFVAVKKGTPLYEKAKALHPTAKPHILEGRK
ncbi:unnamed protein product [Durusdinium trenchii]|uniref:Uncharacterized protein n=2 Tax=Durusdinium trenchii TaxID=1381693 RepID=A0ABP0IF22_9DINO